MFNQKRLKDRKGETPDDLRARYGISKEGNSLNWEMNAVKGIYSKDRNFRSKYEAPKSKEVLAKACELPVEQIAWDLGEVTPETKFINTPEMNLDQLEILARTAQSPEVQIQILRECGISNFEDFSIKLGYNLHLGSPAIDCIVSYINRQLRSVSKSVVDGGLKLCKLLFQNFKHKPELNEKLLLSMIQNVEEFEIVSFFGGSWDFLRKNIPTKILDMLIEQNGVNKDYLSHYNVSGQTLLKVVTGISLSQATPENLQTLSISLKHRNSTPEITQIVLDQFNQLILYDQMKCLHKGLIDGFCNNSLLPAKPFTKFEGLGNNSASAFEANNPESLDSKQPNPQIDLSGLYHHTKNLDKDETQNPPSFDAFIYKITTEPNFPKGLQTEFFKLWLDQHNAEDPLLSAMAQNVTVNEQNEILPWAPDNFLYKSLTQKTTDTAILRIYFEKVEAYIQGREKDKTYHDRRFWAQSLEKIATQNPNLAIDKDLNIVDIRTQQQYYKIDGSEHLDRETYFKNLFKVPSESEDDRAAYIKRAEFVFNNWDIRFTAQDFENFINIDGWQALSPKIFTKLIRDEAALFQKDKAKYLWHKIKLIEELLQWTPGNLKEIYKTNPELIQEWIGSIYYNIINNSGLSSIVKERWREILNPILKSEYTPLAILQDVIVNAGLATKEDTMYICQTLLENPNLTSDMINQIIIIITQTDAENLAQSLEGMSFGDGAMLLSNLAFDKLLGKKRTYISPETWKMIINHPNCNHGDIGQLFSRADEETQATLITIYAELMNVHGNQIYLLQDPERLNMLSKVPFPIWKLICNEVLNNGVVTKEYSLHSRNYSIRNNPANQSYLQPYLKNKTLPVDMNRFFTIETWFSIFYEVADRTRSNYKPTTTTSIEEYIHTNDESLEFNIAHLLDITNPTGIPALLAEILNSKILGKKIDDYLQLTDGSIDQILGSSFFENFDIQIDRTIPDAPNLVFRTAAKSRKEANAMIRFFHEAQEIKDPKLAKLKVNLNLPQKQLVDFQIVEQTDLNKHLDMVSIEWSIPMPLYNKTEADRKLFIDNINDQLNKFRNKILPIAQQCKKAAIEAKLSYLERARQMDVKGIVTELSVADISEEQLQEWLKVLSAKLEDPKYLRDEADKAELAKLDLQLGELKDNTLLNNIIQNKESIYTTWIDSINLIPKDLLTGIAKEILPAESFSKILQDENYNENIKAALLGQFKSSYNLEDTTKFVSIIRLAFIGRFHEILKLSLESYIKNHLETSDPESEQGKLALSLKQDISKLVSNRVAYNDLRRVFDKKIPIITSTIYGGLVWKIQEVKSDTIKKLNAADDTPAPASQIPLEERDNSAVVQISTPGVLVSLQSNLETCKSIFDSLPTDADKNLKTEIYIEYLKTQILIQLFPI